MKWGMWKGLKRGVGRRDNIEGGRGRGETLTLRMSEKGLKIIILYLPTFSTHIQTCIFIGNI